MIREGGVNPPQCRYGESDFIGQVRILIMSLSRAGKWNRAHLRPLTPPRKRSFFDLILWLREKFTK